MSSHHESRAFSLDFESSFWSWLVDFSIGEFCHNLEPETTDNEPKPPLLTPLPIMSNTCNTKDSSIAQCVKSRRDSDLPAGDGLNTPLRSSPIASSPAFVEATPKCQPEFPDSMNTLKRGDEFAPPPSHCVLPVYETAVVHQKHTDATNRVVLAKCVAQKWTRRFSPSKAQRIYIAKSDITPQDILCGSNSASLDQLVRAFWSRFESYDAHAKWLVLKKTSGRRFVKQTRDGRFHLMTVKEARSTVGQAFHEREST